MNQNLNDVKNIKNLPESVEKNLINWMEVASAHKQNARTKLFLNPRNSLKYPTTIGQFGNFHPFLDTFKIILFIYINTHTKLLTKS